MIDLLKFSISADDRTARAFGTVKGELKGVKGMLAGVDDYARRAGRNMRNIGLGASAAITAPLTLLGRESVKLFDQQAKAQAAVEQVLVSTGGAAGKSADELFRMASGLQSISTYGDEDILQNVTAPLLTFTQISGDVFDRAQANVLDMATLMKMDLKSASILVGKALNDPVKGLSALSRTGVQFSEDQKDVIKSLVETGDVASAQGLILQELEKQFGGQAAAAAKVGLGPMKQLSNLIGDVKEQLGAEIASFLPPLVDRVKSAVEWFSKLSPEVKTNIVVFGGIAAAAGPVLALLGTAVLGVTALTGAIKAMGLVVLTNPILAIIAGVAAGAYLIYRNWEGISQWFAELWETVKTGVSAGWDAIKTTLSTYSPDWLKDLWSGLGSFFSLQWGAVRIGLELGWDGIKGLLSGTYSPREMIYNAWEGIADWFRGLAPELKQAFMDLWTAVKLEVSEWPGRMIQVGKDSITGLIEGLFGGQSEVEKMGVRTGRNLVRGTKKALDSNSPSKKFIEIGRDVIAGLGIGLKQDAGDVTEAMEGIVGDLVGATASAGQMGQRFGQAFSAVSRGAQSAGQAVSGFFDNIADRIFTNAGNKLFTSLFGGLFDSGGAFDFLFNADGNAFSGGRVVPFATGGVVSSPTFFPMAGSQTGVMGEAGPEAIMPLTRIGGKLGVRAEGGARSTAIVRIEAPEGFTATQLNQSRDVAIEVVQAGITEYDSKVMPGRVNEITADPLAV